MPQTVTDTRRDAAKKDAQLLRFRVAGGEYAFPLTEVREIVPVSPCTPVPGAPAHVKGILNIRGKVLTVVDLAAFLKLAPGAEPKFVIVAEKGTEFYGFLAEEVTGVMRVDAADLKPVPELMAAAVRAGFVDSAVVIPSADPSASDRMFLVLALQNLLASLAPVSA
jgi:purine-binding chemotaxis protein CheW